MTKTFFILLLITGAYNGGIDTIDHKYETKQECEMHADELNKGYPDGFGVPILHTYCIELTELEE